MNHQQTVPFAVVFPEFYGVHGIARYIDSFLSNLPENSPNIYVIAGDEYQHARQYRNVEIIHLPFRSTRVHKFLWILKVRKVLKALYREQKIQAVNLHIPPLIPGLFLPKEIPLILTTHTTYLGMSGLFYPHQYFKSQWGKLETSIKRWMERLIFRRAHIMIALTAQGEAEILQYDYDKTIKVIPNGVDTTLFKPDLQVEKKFDVLFCGRIETRKGSRSMVEVCRALVKQKPEIKILIVGYGDDDAWVNAQLAENSQNITLTGKVPFAEMQTYYHQSRIYVSTSYYEGLPGTCLEAMAMGLPAIVWDFLFYQNLVVENQTGYLLPVNDYFQMAEKVIACLAEPVKLEQMSLQARQKVNEDYQWKYLSQHVLDVITV